MRKSRLIALAALSLVLAACATGTVLRPEKIHDPSVIAGTYTMYLYSTRQYEGLDGLDSIVGAVAILDVEDDNYEFKLYAPGADYSVREGVPGPEAVKAAGEFLKRFRGRPVYRRISAEGKTIGYEIRSSHKSWIYIRSTVNVSYRLIEGRDVEVLFSIGPPSPEAPVYGR